MIGNGVLFYFLVASYKHTM